MGNIGYECECGGFCKQVVMDASYDELDSIRGMRDLYIVSKNCPWFKSNREDYFIIDKDKYGTAVLLEIFED